MVRVREADLARHEQVLALCEELARLPVSMLVNSAALAHYGPFAELPPEQADDLVQLNVLAPVLLTRAVVTGMRERAHGSVINVASLLAFSGPIDTPGLPARGVYAASKAFLLTFTQILAAELRDAGVQVQVVCPGVVRSEFHSRQGIDMSAVPRMDPELIVEASLLDLERGEVVSLPGVADVNALDQLRSAQQELLRSTRTTELPARYR
jgi:short-subunit dehydrogenase